MHSFLADQAAALYTTVLRINSFPQISRFIHFPRSYEEMQQQNQHFV